MKLAIATGNTKLGKVHNISLPPCSSCHPDIPCATLCYARKAWIQYPSTRAAWTQNWNAWQANQMGYMETIANYCATKRVERFRWHVAGDVPDKAYLNGMILVAQCNPDTQFLFFTKRPDLLVNTRLASNLRPVISMWPGVLRHFRQTMLIFAALPNEEIVRGLQRLAPLAWMNPAKPTEDTWYNTEVDIVARTEGLECSGRCDECFMCWYMEPESSVVFHQH